MAIKSLAVSFGLGAAAVAGLVLAGPLNPPAGPVTSTYKTLSEIEPRIAINSSNTPGDATSQFIISQPGSYYLVGPVAAPSGRNGIKITASNVTLDLRGFTLSGAAGSAAGIALTATAQRAAISNGTITGFGLDGIDGGFNLLGRYERLILSGNGASLGGRFGLRAGGEAIILNCNASSNSGGGINGNDHCSVDACVANGNLDIGIKVGNDAVIRGCTASSNGLDGIQTADAAAISACAAAQNTGNGLSTGAASNISHCTAKTNSGIGINVPSGCMVDSCSCTGNLADGIRASLDCLILNNTCYFNNFGGSGANIHVTTAYCRVEGNLCTSGSRGIKVDGFGNIIIRNTCRSNTTNWDVVAGNTILVVQGSAAGAVLGNTGGTAPGSTDPNANFSF